MPAFVNSAETVTIRDSSWEPSEGVVIKAKMSLADEEWISNKYLAMNKDASGVDASLGSIKRRTIERMVVSWTFRDPSSPDANPRYAPKNEEAVGSLSKEYADYIYDQINKRNQPMTEVEQKDFLPDANPSTPELSETI